MFSAYHVQVQRFGIQTIKYFSNFKGRPCLVHVLATRPTAAGVAQGDLAKGLMVSKLEQMSLSLVSLVWSGFLDTVPVWLQYGIGRYHRPDEGDQTNGHLT